MNVTTLPVMRKSFMEMPRHNKDLVADDNEDKGRQNDVSRELLRCPLFVALSSFEVNLR